MAALLMVSPLRAQDNRASANPSTVPGTGRFVEIRVQPQARHARSISSDVSDRRAAHARALEGRRRGRLRSVAPRCRFVLSDARLSECRGPAAERGCVLRPFFDRRPPEKGPCPFLLRQNVTRTRYVSTAVASVATGTAKAAAHASVLVHVYDDRSIRHVPPTGSLTSTVIGDALWLRSVISYSTS